MTKRLRQIPSDRELYRRLWNDPTLRMIYDLETTNTGILKGLAKQGENEQNGTQFVI
jgi:hypothetical protein